MSAGQSPNWELVVEAMMLDCPNLGGCVVVLVLIEFRIVAFASLFIINWCLRMTRLASYSESLVRRAVAGWEGRGRDDEATPTTHLGLDLEPSTTGANS